MQLCYRKNPSNFPSLGCLCRSSQHICSIPGKLPRSDEKIIFNRKMLQSFPFLIKYKRVLDKYISQKFRENSNKLLRNTKTIIFLSNSTEAAALPEHAERRRQAPLASHLVGPAALPEAETTCCPHPG